jgi:PAS domain S-box-containing protein
VERAATISYEEVLDVPAGRRSFNTTLVPVIDASGRVHRIIGVAHDVTKERETVEALRASEERFRQLAENVREVFWLRDVESNALLYISPGYELVWALSPETIMANPMAWGASIHPDDRARVAAVDARTRLEPTDTTYRIVRPDGAERWVRARTFLVRGAEGQTYRINVDIGATDESGLPAGPYVLFAAKDTGAGMDGPTQAPIFEPFFTTKEVGSGTGLGLATVFGIMEQSGGAIRVESAPGKGSTFFIYFPRVAEALPVAVAVAVAEASASTAGGNETILLVEDDHQVREATRAILRRLGYVVLDAQNAGEALLSCEQHEGPIHLLLTDVVMPRMSGRQLAERLGPLRPEMKVLFMSGYPDASFGDGNVIDEATSFVAKPVTPEALGAKVRAVIDARR